MADFDLGDAAFEALDAAIGIGLFRPAAPLLPQPAPGRAAGVSPQADTVSLQNQVDRLNLMVQTMLKLMIEKGLTSKEEFTQWMEYMDQLDGSPDGRLRREAGPRDCPMCRRKNPPHAAMCQYCGGKLDMKIFDHEPPGAGG